MNKFKNIPFTLIIISIIYVVLEIMFRSNLLNVTATMQDNSEIIKLENVGRFLSSLGFALFITSLIKIKKEQRNRTKFLIYISYPFIFLLSFYGFSQGQKNLIDYIAQNVSTQMKREMLLTSLVKEAIYFDKIKVKPIYNSETKNDIDSKVFLSFFPAIIVGSDLTKKYEKNINDLVDITLTEKIIKNKDASNKEIEKFIKNYLENYRKTLDVISYGEKNNYTGFKEKDIKLMLNFIASYMSIHASYINSVTPTMDYFEKKNKDAHRADTLSVISESLNKLENGYDFNNYFNSRISFHMDLDFIYLEREILMLDGAFAQLVKAEDYNALLKYYGFGLDIKNQCQINKSEKNSLIFYHGYTKEHYYDVGNYPKDRFNLMFENFYKQLTDRVQKENVSIVCDYSYNAYLKLLNRIEKYFKTVSPYFNKDKFSIKNLNANTVNNNYYYRRMALNLMFKFIYENTGKNIIHKFENFQDFDNFRNSIVFSESGFYKSMNKYMYNKYLKVFNERTKNDNLNFNYLLNTDINFGVPDSFNQKIVVDTFKKGMPFIVNEENKFFKSMKELDENKKIDLRLYYVEHKKKIYNEILTNTKLLEEGEKYETIGNDIAKGFIAPIFVLSISNIMIIISIINIFIKVIEVFEIKKIKLIKSFLIISLICIPYFASNRYSEDKLFHEYPNKKILSLVNWTQNTENILHRFDNDIGFFEGIYSFIETVTAEKEKRR